jgi:hypothetical protein
MEQAKKFCALNGIEWHEITNLNVPIFDYLICTCGEKLFTFEVTPHCNHFNPTFTDAKSIIEVMEKRDDFMDFVNSYAVGLAYCDRQGKYLGGSIYIEFILNPDELLGKAIMFCQENNVEGK